MAKFTLDELKADPAFQALPRKGREEAEAAYTGAAWEEQRADTGYVSGTEETRSAFRDAFVKKHPMAAPMAVEEENRDNTVLTNMGKQFVQGAKTMAQGMQSYDEAMGGAVDPDFAQRLYSSHVEGTKNYIPPELRKLYASMGVESKRWEQADGFAEKAAAAGMTIGKTFSELFNNPEGVAYLFAQSGANMFAPMVGGAAGAAAGTAIAGPAGTAVGGAVGMFTGGQAVETGAYLNDLVLQEVQNRGLEMSPASIAQVVADNKFFQTARNKAQLKGIATAGVDTALGLGIGKMGTKSIRQAEKQAAKTLGRAATKEAMESEVRSLLKARPVTKVVGEKVKATAAEIVSEPVSEAAGELAAEGKVDAGELMGETLGGIAGGPIMAPIEGAIYGAKHPAKVAERIKETVGKVMPAAKTAEETTLEAQAKAPTAHNYQETVDAAVEKGDVGEMGDATSEKFNPVPAVAALGKMAEKVETQSGEKADILLKTRDILDAVESQKQELGAKMAAIQAIPAADRTQADKDSFNSMLKQAKSITKIQLEVNPTYHAMAQVPVAEQAKMAVQIKEALKDEDASVDDAIIASFGSKAGRQAAEHMDEVLQNPKASPQTKAMAEAVKTYQASEDTLMEAQVQLGGKTASEVHGDVIEGGANFLGIKDYAQSVAAALGRNHMEKAGKTMDMFGQFVSRHQDKTATFNKVKAFYKANPKAEALSPELQEAMAPHNAIRRAEGKGDYDLSTGASNNFVSLMNHEVKALVDGYTMLQAMVAAKTTPAAATAADTVVEERTTGSAPDVAVAKEEGTESVREETTEEGAVAAAPEPKKKETPKQPAPVKAETKTPELIQSMENAGFRETEIAKMTPGQAKFMQQYESSTVAELTAEAKKFKQGSAERALMRKLYTAFKRRPAPVVAFKKDAKHVSFNKDLTTHDPADPTNEIRNTMKGVPSKGILHQTDDVVGMLGSEQVEEFFTETYPLDDKAQSVVNSVKQFLGSFKTAFVSEYVAGMPNKTQDWRWRNPIQFLIQDPTNPPANVVNAVAAASWEWLASRAAETETNDTDAVRQLLGMKDDEHVFPIAEELLAEAGMTGTYLQEALGARIVKLLGLKETEATEAKTKNRLELSLGLQAIATMESLGLIEHKQVRTGVNVNANAKAIGQATQGFTGLINMHKDKKYTPEKYANVGTNFFVTPGEKGSFYRDPDTGKVSAMAAGEGTVDFYRIVTGTEKHAWIKTNMMDTHGKSPHTFNLVFDGEQNRQTYTRTQPMLTEEQAKLKGTDFVAAEEQSKNLSKHQRKGWKPAQRHMGFYLLLPDMTRKRLMGWRDPDSTLDSRKKTTAGVNRGIDRSHEAIQNFLVEADDYGYDGEFFIPEEFWRQGRMGQLGPINPQGDKTHRGLFNMSAWDQTVDLNNDDHIRMFLEGVALNFDVEAIKTGGINAAVNKTLEKIRTPEVQKALAGITYIMREQGDMDTLFPAELEQVKESYASVMEDIAVGVEATEMGMRGMKALVEYARFLEAQKAFKKDPSKSSFQTDLTTEVDGISNGVIMAHFQLTTDKADMGATLAALQNGGVAFSPDQPSTAVHAQSSLSHDAYQSTGFAWTTELTKIEHELVTELHEAAPQEKAELTRQLEKLQAMKRLFGEFRSEDGNVTGTVRKVSKDPTMRTMYGMGLASLMKELQQSFSKDLDDKIEVVMELSKTDSEKALKKFDEIAFSLNQFFGYSFFPANVVVNGEVNINVLKKFALNPKQQAEINAHIEKNHGQALEQAIERVFQPIKEAMKPLNAGIQLSAVLYNTLYKAKLKILKRERGKNGRIDVGDIQKIERDIKELFPTITTPFGAPMPLAKRSREKKYSDKDSTNVEVTQKYKKLQPAKKAAPFKQEGLDAPGVAGVILSVHDMDSFVANMVMAAHNILNNHDGFSTGVLEAGKMSNTANEQFFKVMSEFNMAESLSNAAGVVQEQFMTQAKDLMAGKQISQAEVTQLLKEEFNAMGMDTYKPRGAMKSIFVTPQNYGMVLNDMKSMAAEVTANKKKITDAVYSVNQYFYEGAEHETKQAPKAITHGGVTYQPTQITSLREAVLKEEIAYTQTLLDQMSAMLKKESDGDILSVAEEGIGSSPGSATMSTDPTDYSIQQEVNGMNAVHVYDKIKNESTIKIDPEHDQHLQGILNDVVRKVLDPIDVFMKSTPDFEPEGHFVVRASGESQIFLSHQNQIIGPVSGALSQGIRMSSGEVFVHELLHPVLRVGLKTKAALRAKVNSLYNVAFKKLGPDGFKYFLNDPNTDLTDPAYKYEIEAAKERYNYVFRNTVGQKTDKFPIHEGVDPATGIKRQATTSAHLDEFLVLALTNKNFMKALSGLPLDTAQYSKAGLKALAGKNIQETLANIGQMIMDLLFKASNLRKTRGTMDKELRELAVLLAQKDSQTKSKLYLAMQKASQQSSKVSEMGNKFIKEVAYKKTIGKTVEGLRASVKHAKASDTALGQYFRNIDHGWRRMDQSITKSIVQDVKGRTERMGWLYDRLDRRQLVLDAAKQEEVATTVSVANDLFADVELEDHHKPAITQAAVRTDAGVIYRDLGTQVLKDVLRSDKAAMNQVNRLLRVAKRDKELMPFLTYYQRAADAMGHYMATGQGRSQEEVFQNAWVIATLENTSHVGEISLEASERAEKLVDQLGSLYAVRYTAKDSRQAFLELLEADPKGANGLFMMHEVLKDRAFNDNFGGKKAKMIKGYTKDIVNPRIDYTYGALEDEAEFARLGYVRKDRPLGRDKDDPTKDKDMYVYVSRQRKIHDLRPGIASFTGHKAKGASSSVLAEQMGLLSSEGKKNNKAIIKARQAVIEDMFLPGVTPALEDGNFMISQVNDNGKITQYRYIMSSTAKDNHLERDNDFDTIFGAMAGQIMDKVRTPPINRDLVEGLFSYYSANYQQNPGEFVEIGTGSSDPRLAEIYRMLPPSARNDVKTIWGQNQMWVPKDFIDIAFGFREYSITEPFTKDPKERAMLENMLVKVSQKFLGESKAVKALGTMEEVAVFLTKMSKGNIVVKGLWNTLGNFSSNLIYLKSKGVPVNKIIQMGWEALIQGNKYQVQRKQLETLKLKREIRQKAKASKSELDTMSAQILRLEADMTLNPVTIGIEAGLMPTLVDEIDTITSGTAFPSDFEKTITSATEKLPQIIQNVGKIAFVTEDTQMFKVLNNAVKMTDFVGRHVLYNHYISQGMEHEEAITKAKDEFINFNTPSHRMIEWGNKVGALWFTKYGTRVLKVITESVSERPFDVFTAWMLSVHTGMDNILNSIPFVTKDPMSMLGDPVSSIIDTWNNSISMQTIDDLI